MNEKNLYHKLVDLYAGDELPLELKDELESAAQNDQELAFEMHTLKTTVDQLHRIDSPQMSEESFQRVLMRLYTAGVEPETRSSEPVIFQHQLPMQG